LKTFWIASTLGLVAARVIAQAASKSDLLARIDHIVYATPDLNAGIEAIEKLTGVRATPGGRHPGRGTRNALIALGPTSYLEIIGPDPEQPAPPRPRAFGIDGLKAPRLARWVVKAQSLEQLAAEASRKGIHLGEVTGGKRQRPDGALLTWRYTDPLVDLADGLVPFFIDWGESPHPAATAAKGLTLIALRGEHPDAAQVGKILISLGLDLPLRTGPAPTLIATIDSPRGRVELR
jgi:Glyoxalase-like domain